MEVRQFKYEWLAENSGDCELEMQEAQQLTHYVINGKPYARVRFGREDWDSGAAGCGDCAVSLGEYHLPGCDIEMCPRCRGQALCCDCFHDDHDNK